MAVLTGLLLAAGNAAALGLGQIEVKSRLNQPLLAEIPIISTTPGELQALQARLASPETFRRIGLAAPTGAAANLQFSLGSDARGRPVIRVTTVAPVDQAVLNFLIEVDWGQGRLVREYSALVDAPRTASAPVQPAISAPVVAAPNVVQRPDTPPVAALPVPVPPPPPPPPPPPHLRHLRHSQRSSRNRLRSRWNRCRRRWRWCPRRRQHGCCHPRRPAAWPWQSRRRHPRRQRPTGATDR
ncbi:hypothetical protein [Thermomonas sp.]|uniref:type IV pilus assembly protein FimV n=1 Tax=Thermomonas sp. TaxID=1971895 RepID=UPI0029FC65CB|nr:hypothetical protein [Thermomonas sp.]